MAVPLAAAAGDGRIGVNLAVENQNIAVGAARREEKRQRQRIECVVLITLAPVLRPIAQRIAFAQIRRQPRLLVAVAGADVMKIRAEIVQKRGKRAEGKTINRAVANHAPRPFPVADDKDAVARIRRVREKMVDIAQDDHIQIEKQRRAAEAVKFGGEGRQLAPAALRNAVRQIQRRDGMTDHRRINPGRVVGEANHRERQRQMPRNHAVEAVDELGRVLGTPLHAEDVACGHENSV